MKVVLFRRRLKTGLALLTLVVVSVFLSSTLQADETTAIKGEVTFSRDIAPILQRSCQNCHQPNSVAPMSLIISLTSKFAPGRVPSRKGPLCETNGA